MTYTVVVTDRVSASGLTPLIDDEQFEVVTFPDSSAKGFAEALKKASALIVRSATTVDGEMLDSAPALKVVGRAGVGVDNIDIDGATDRGIVVFNSPDGNTVAAAEMTMALILALVRHVPDSDQSIRAGEWERARFKGVQLRGKTLGLIGAGRIGGEVARFCHSFGMKVVAHDPYLSSERAQELDIGLVEIADVVEVADVISFHVPLTSETEGMVDTVMIDSMKPGVFLINASRGGVIDEAALAEALHDGRVAGAALDVYESEPLPDDSPLRGAPNLVLTPHLGASTREAQVNVALDVSESIRRALLEGDVGSAVNADRLKT